MALLLVETTLKRLPDDDLGKSLEYDPPFYDGWAESTLLGAEAEADAAAAPNLLRKLNPFSCVQCDKFCAQCCELTCLLLGQLTGKQIVVLVGI